MATSGAEVVAFLEVDEPRCALTYGTGLCAAALGTTGAHKCFNTRKTCQDPDNYDPSETVTTRFALQQERTLQYGVVIPIMTAPPDVTPGELNLGGMEPSAGAFGRREVVTARLQDCKHSDHRYDKYRLERYTGDASLLASGDASAGGEDTLTLEAEVADLVGKTLRLTAGAGSVQEREVVAYDGTTKVATVSPRWRTNEFQSSEELDNAYWNKSAIVTADDALGLDGLNSFETVEDDNNAGWELVSRSGLTRDAVGSPVWVAVHIVKDEVPASTRFGLVRLGFTGAALGAQYVDLRFASDTGAILVVPQGAGAIIVDSGVEDKGSHWRVWVAGYTNDAGWLSSSVSFYPAVGAHASLSSYSNTIVGSMGVGGFQYGQGVEPTEYIKTEASPITLPDATTDYEVRDAYDPYERGTFIGKWLARNPYHNGYRARLRFGEIGQALEDMSVRHYIVDSISGPSNGTSTWKLKDLFSKVEARKAQFPPASLGELDGDLTGTPATFDVAPTGIGDTPDSEGGYASITNLVEGHVCIGDECIRVTRVGDTFTVVERGALGTVAEDHEDDDLVQVVGYKSGRVHENIYELLTEDAGVDPADIPFTEWEEKAALMSATNFTAYIPAPTPVNTLIGELMEQGGCTVWADTSTGRIEFSPLRPSAPVETIREADLVSGPGLRRQDTKRISRVLFYYGMRNVTADLDDPTNFHSRVVTPDLPSEDSTQYGSKSLKVVYSRWIQQGGRAPATEGATRLLSMFRDPPYEGELELHRVSEDRLSLAVPFFLESDEAQDATGLPNALIMVPTKKKPGLDTVTFGIQGMQFAIDLGDPNVHEVFIENDSTNINMRTMHDALYAAPTGVEDVYFYIEEGVIVGSTTSAGIAMDTGEWPAGVDLFLENYGRIQGKGGRAGNGGTFGSAGTAGSAGGLALKVRYAITIDNEFGEIWGGGGGGGGGGGSRSTPYSVGGSAAGGGQGYDPGLKGTPAHAGSSGGGGLYGGYPGTNGTTEVNGTGGTTAIGPGLMRGGRGGNGGTAGVAGSAGAAATGGDISNGAGGAGGAAGGAVEGDSFVTWTNTGSRLGAIT